MKISILFAQQCFAAVVRRFDDAGCLFCLPTLFTHVCWFLSFFFCTFSDALNALGLKRYCCRRMLLAHVDLIEKLLNYNCNNEQHNTKYTVYSTRCITDIRHIRDRNCTSTSKFIHPSETILHFHIYCLFRLLRLIANVSFVFCFHLLGMERRNVSQSDNQWAASTSYLNSSFFLSLILSFILAFNITMFILLYIFQVSLFLTAFISNSEPLYYQLKQQANM